MSFDDFWSFGAFDRKSVKIVSLTNLFTRQHWRYVSDQSGCHYVIDLPGLGVEDIEVTCDDQILLVAAKNVTYSCTVYDEHENQPEKAVMKNGRLTVTFKAIEETKPKKITVSAG